MYHSSYSESCCYTCEIETLSPTHFLSLSHKLLHLRYSNSTSRSYFGNKMRRGGGRVVATDPCRGLGGGRVLGGDGRGEKDRLEHSSLLAAVLAMLHVLCLALLQVPLTHLLKPWDLFLSAFLRHNSLARETHL